jgi:two-component system NtrC family sensor kinase
MNKHHKYILMLLVWTSLLGLSLYWNLVQTDQNTLDAAEATARAYINKDLAFRRWMTGLGDVYVQPDTKTPLNPYLLTPNRDEKTISGKLLTLMNPDYALRQLQTEFSNEFGSSHITSLNLVNPDNAADHWEQESLQQFEQGDKERIEVQTINDKAFLRLMIPIFVEESCLKCHGYQNYKVGDVRGGISTSVALSPYLAANYSTDQGIILFHALIWLLGLTGLGLSYQRENHIAASRLKTKSKLIDQNIWLETELQRRQQENQQVQLQMMQSEKLAAIGQLAAGVAHEINNPIGFISSNLNTLKQYIGTLFGIIRHYEKILDAIAVEPEIRKQIANLKVEDELDYLTDDIPQLIAESQEGLNRVSAIVQDLKDFSSADSDAWEMADLNKCLESTLNIIWNEIKYSCEIVKHYGEIPEINCLPAQLNQVFMNLLLNSAQAIKAKGTITISTGFADNHVWVAISDTGSGITPEHINHLFEPFFTTKPVGQGIGLGLSVSQKIIQNHYGNIEVESVLDQGTTFRVTLPIHAQEETTPTDK